MLVPCTQSVICDSVWLPMIACRFLLMALCPIQWVARTAPGASPWTLVQGLVPGLEATAQGVSPWTPVPSLVHGLRWWLRVLISKHWFQVYSSITRWSVRFFVYESWSWSLQFCTCMWFWSLWSSTSTPWFTSEYRSVCVRCPILVMVMLSSSLGSSSWSTCFQIHL